MNETGRGARLQFRAITAVVAALCERRFSLLKTGAHRAPLQRAFTLAVLVLAAVATSAIFAVMGFSAEVRPIAQTQSTTPECASQVPAANAPMTAAQGEEIIRELHAIQTLLQNGAARGAPGRRPATPQPVKMRIGSGWHALGSAHAPVTMIEFTDLQCPFCRRFQTTTFSEIKKDYIDTGKLRFIARSLPLPMHAYALGAAEAARCAGDQGKFWQFRDAVLADQAPPTADVLQKHASELGLNLGRFQGCLREGKYKQVIEADRSDAAGFGIHGTPAFVIGRAEGSSLDGVSFVGARPLPYFKQEIEAMLNESASASAKMHPAGEATSVRAAGFAGKQ